MPRFETIAVPLGKLEFVLETSAAARGVKLHPEEAQCHAKSARLFETAASQFHRFIWKGSGRQSRQSAALGLAEFHWPCLDTQHFQETFKMTGMMTC